MRQLTLDLGAALPAALPDGVTLLSRLARPGASALMSRIHEISARAPFRRLYTPGGQALSAMMTNCGPLGWHSDARGYRYVHRDPLSGAPWPPLPDAFLAIAAEAAGRAGLGAYAPDACLINRYLPGARMGLHQDRNEADLTAPVVSVSLGLAATFLIGGARRSDPVQPLRLEHGDVLVWAGPARMRFHGVRPVADGHHPVTGAARYNLTFRVAGRVG